MKSILIISMLLVSLLSCFFKNKDIGKWELVSPKGLNDYIKDPQDPRYPSYPDKVIPFFISDTVGFLYGNTKTTKRWDKNPNLLVDKAIIYKTTNGGYNWNKHDFAESEIAYSVYKEKDKIVLITFDGKMMNILESYNIGDNWFKKESFDTKKIENLDWTNFESNIFQDSFWGMAISSDSKNFYQTKQITNTWQKYRFSFETYNINPESIFWGESDCWFTSWEDKRQFLGYLNFENNTGHLEELNFEGQSITISPSGSIWIGGKQENDAVIYERTEKDKFRLIKKIPYRGGDYFFSTKHLYSNTDEQIWVYSDVKFYPENHFLLSRDGGKTWDEEELPFSSGFDNPYFYHDKGKKKTLVWVNIGGGRLMMRK
jgi:hypothetical protein